MLAFSDPHRERDGVESSCAGLPIAPSTYSAHQARAVNPAHVPPRAQRDARLKLELRRGWEETLPVDGGRQRCRQLGREGLSTARGTVARLMRARGLRGVGRGRRGKTTPGDQARARPWDRGHRHFKANRPNALWVSDRPSVATWQGVSYVALVIDAYARRRGGWRVAPSLSPDLALDALEQARYARLRGRAEDWGHPRDRGVQSVAVRYPQRLAAAGIEPAVGRVGDSDDNALAESVMSLYKTERIGPRGPGRTVEAVEFATLGWVDGFNPRRLLEPLGHRPPAEVEAASDEHASALAA